MKKQYDIIRLGKIITAVERCFDLVGHMDEKEYKRMRDYIGARFDVGFPYTHPAYVQKAEKKS